MTDELTLIFNYKAEPKQRPRFSRKSGRPYTPKETRSFEAVTARVAKSQFPYAPLTRDVGGIKLEIDCYFKKARTNKSLQHLQKPDLTNLSKAIEDAFNKVIYEDDSQITCLVVRKHWDKKDWFKVVISRAN
jgi:Holliday junction resolvase RusA-like endonuclease